MTRGVLLLSLGLASVAVSAEAPDPAVQAAQVFEEGLFPFCVEGEWQIRSGWCEVAELAQSCPELARACARARATDAGEPSSWASSGAGGADAPEQGLFKGVVARAFRKVRDQGESAIPWQHLSTVLLVLVVLVAAVLLAWVLARRRRNGGSLNAPTAASLEGEIVLPTERLRSAEVLLMQARNASEDPGRALRLLYAAALSHLEEAGLIRWEPTTTNRVFVRAIRGRTSMDAPFSDLVAEVERIRFGGREPSQQSLVRLIERISPFISRAMLVLVLVAGGCTCRGDHDLDGRAAFTEILGMRGVKVKAFAGDVESLDAKSPPLLVDARSRRLACSIEEQLREAAELGARVGILYGVPQELCHGRWRVVSDEEVSAGGSAVVPEPPLLVSSGSRPVLLDMSVEGHLPGNHRFESVPCQEGLYQAEAIDETEDEEEGLEEPCGCGCVALPVASRDGEPFVMSFPHLESGLLLHVADRRLLSNASMAIPDNARLAVSVAELLLAGADELRYADVGLLEPPVSPMDAMGRAGMWPLLVQVLLVMGVLVIARGAAFGTLRDRQVRTRRRFGEHVEALASMLHLTGGTALVARWYASFALERLWKRVGQGLREREPDDLARELAHRLGQPVEPLVVLLRAAGIRRSTEDAVTDLPDIQLMRSLHELLRAVDASASGGATKDEENLR